MPFTPKILIVDDDPKMTASIQALLDGRGYDLHTAHRATDALARLHSEAFHLAILDVMMPVMSGFELMDAVDRRNVDTRFIIITGDASMESAVKAIRRGASDYLKKPFEPDELLIRVKNLLQPIKGEIERQAVEAKNRQLEHQLRQSQKMEAIGTLAGGIAHDFNNILGIILGNVELALAVSDPTNPAKANLDKIKTAGMRAKELIAQLLSYSRKTEIEKKTIDMNALIDQALKLLRASIPSQIEIRPPTSRRSFNIIGDETQLSQILLNLCTNAAQAMGNDSGLLGVRLVPVQLADTTVTDTGNLPAGEYVQLIVSDTGPGIDPAIRDHLFEPYFTTKNVGKGTGMGLAVVHGIVKAHGGAIDIHSEPGHKTEFCVYLPVIEEDAVCRTGDDAQALSRGQGRILVIDDEPMIVEMMKQMLELMGYEVCEQTDSQTALAIFRQNSEAFDLVLSDMSMPGLSGDRLARKIKAIRPDIPVVLCTGNDDPLTNNPQRQEGIDEVVLKPVGMKQLAQRLHKLLQPRTADRRQDTRYPMQGKAFVISKVDDQKQGGMIDISRSGLSFSYVKNGDSDDPFKTVSIASMDRALVLSNLSYRIAWDKSAENGQKPFSGTLRKRGGQFDRLSPAQQDGIAQLISQYASAHPAVS